MRAVFRFGSQYSDRIQIQSDNVTYLLDEEGGVGKLEVTRSVLPPASGNSNACRLSVWFAVFRSDSDTIRQCHVPSRRRRGRWKAGSDALGSAASERQLQCVPSFGLVRSIQIGFRYNPTMSRTFSTKKGALESWK